MLARAHLVRRTGSNAGYPTSNTQGINVDRKYSVTVEKATTANQEIANTVSVSSLGTEYINTIEHPADPFFSEYAQPKSFPPSISMQGQSESEDMAFIFTAGGKPAFNALNEEQHIAIFQQMLRGVALQGVAPNQDTNELMLQRVKAMMGNMDIDTHSAFVRIINEHYVARRIGSGDVSSRPEAVYNDILKPTLNVPLSRPFNNDNSKPALNPSSKTLSPRSLSVRTALNLPPLNDKNKAILNIPSTQTLDDKNKAALNIPPISPPLNNKNKNNKKADIALKRKGFADLDAQLARNGRNWQAAVSIAKTLNAKASENLQAVASTATPSDYGVPSSAFETAMAAAGSTHRSSPHSSPATRSPATLYACSAQAAAAATVTAATRPIAQPRPRVIADNVVIERGRGIKLSPDKLASEEVLKMTEAAGPCAGKKGRRTDKGKGRWTKN